MALAIDGTPVSGTATGGTTVAATLTVPTAGDIIILEVHAEAVTAQANFPTVSGVSGAGLTWFKRSSANFSAGGFGSSYNRFEVWWAYSSGSFTSQAITATLGGVTIDDMSCVAFGVKGFTGTDYQTNPWDSHASLPAVATGTTSSAPTVSGISTTSANVMVLDLIGSPDTTSGSGDIAGAGGTSIAVAHNGGGTNNSNCSAYQSVFSSAQSGITVDGAGVAKNGWLIIGDALAQAGTPGGGGALVLGWQNIPNGVLPSGPFRADSAPAFVSTFRTAPVSGMAWQEPPDRIKLPPLAVFSAPPAFARALTVPISGMAWFEPRDIDALPKGRFVTDPAAIVYIPATVTWSFLVGDTVWLRDAPIDAPPGFGRGIIQTVGISGMAWQAPLDRQPPAIRINIEALAAIALTPATLPVPIRGMAWYEPPDRDKAPFRATVDYPPAFGRALTGPVNTNAGMPWFEPPDRDRSSARASSDYPPAFGGIAPLSISGMAWFQPPDRYNPIRVLSDGAAPAQVPLRSQQSVGIGWFAPSEWRRSASRINETAPAGVLNKPAAPVGISGMSWMMQPDAFRSSTKPLADNWQQAFLHPITVTFTLSPRLVVLPSSIRGATVPAQSRLV